MKEWDSYTTDTRTFLLCHSWKAMDALGCLSGRINVPLQDYFLSWVFCLFWAHWRDHWSGVECAIEPTLMVLIHWWYEEETLCSNLGFRCGFITIYSPTSVSSWWPPLVSGGFSEVSISQQKHRQAELTYLFGIYMHKDVPPLNPQKKKSFATIFPVGNHGFGPYFLWTCSSQNLRVTTDSGMISWLSFWDHRIAYLGYFSSPSFLSRFLEFFGTGCSRLYQHALFHQYKSRMLQLRLGWFTVFYSLVNSEQKS